MSMNPLLLAKQGFGGGVLSIALMGVISVGAVVVPAPVTPPTVKHTGGGGGGSAYRYRTELAKYYNKVDNEYIIPVSLVDENEEEEMIMQLLMEISVNELL